VSDDTKPAARKPRQRKVAPKSLAEAVADVSTTAAKLLIRLPMAVRWRDLDAFNHVNNANFLTYLEESRLQWLQSLSGPWLTDDSAPLLAAANINFRRPIEYPGTIVVELYVERAGNTSLTLAHRIVSANDAAVLYADGTTVMVWIDRRNGRPAPLPDAIRAACG